MSQTLQMTAAKLVPATALHLRPAEERCKADHGWLKTNYSFSFSSYHDPRYMGHGYLRVINDDRIAGGGGFPMHPHNDMEIFSYILEGALSHKDSMGNGSTVKAGGIQYMSAGKGVRHSEFNPSATQAMRLLQIWLLPTEVGAEPRYETMDIDPAEKDGKLKLFLSPDGRDGSIAARTKGDVYAATLNGVQKIEFEFPENHVGWVQIATGNVTLNGMDLREGDGVAITQGGVLEFTKGEGAEFLLFDMWK